MTDRIVLTAEERALWMMAYSASLPIEGVVRRAYDARGNPIGVVDQDVEAAAEAAPSPKE